MAEQRAPGWVSDIVKFSRACIAFIIMNWALSHFDDEAYFIEKYKEALSFINPFLTALKRDTLDIDVYIFDNLVWYLELSNCLDSRHHWNGFSATLLLVARYRILHCSSVVHLGTCDWKLSACPEFFQSFTVVWSWHYHVAVFCIFRDIFPGKMDIKVLHFKD